MIGEILMFTSIRIKNFRGIQDFELKGFKRVNLITGKNSSGKTSILEALFLVSGKDNLSLVSTVNGMRGVNWLTSDFEQTFAPMFNNNQTELPIVFRAWTNRDWMSVEFSLSNLLKLQPNKLNNMAATNQYNKQLVLRYTDSNKRESETRFYPEGDGLQITPARQTPLSGIYLSSLVGQAAENIDRFSKLDIENAATFVVEALRTIEPRLVSLNVSLLNKQACLFADLGLKRKIPLQYAGEGVQKMATIALALSAAKAGIVLIDEIENGFHYSVLPAVWELIFKTAEAFDIQVIMTTHSWECLQAADSVANNLDIDSFAMFRIDRLSDGTTESQSYDRDTLSKAVHENIEVR